MIRFLDGLYVSDDFQLAMNFAIPARSLVAVLGPSGAGKSTLLSVVAGFEPLAKGTLSIGGRQMSDVAPADRPVSMIFQDNNTFAHLTAFENIGLGMATDLRLSPAQKAVVVQALAATGIGHLADRRPNDMSGGERQRIALARALVRERPILLLDEAFAALGPGLRREMLALVRRLHDDKALTTLMVTHNPDDAQRIADAIVFVDEGVVHPPVSVAEFFASDSEDIRRYLGEWL